MVTTVVIPLKQISTRFSIAVHTLSLIAVSSNECTGDFILKRKYESRSHQKNYGNVKKAGLVTVRSGVGGASLRKAPEEITLLDIYQAVNVIEEKRLFRFHEDPNERCPVGRNIELALQSELSEAQSAMEHRLSLTTLNQLTAKFK